MAVANQEKNNMDPAIDGNDVCLTTPLLANLSLNSDANEADVPPVQPVVHTGADDDYNSDANEGDVPVPPVQPVVHTDADDDYDGPFIPRRKTFSVASAARCATDSSSPPPKVCKPGL